MFRRVLLPLLVAVAVASAILTATPAAAMDDEPFCDVDATDYYRDAVAWAKSTGITTGMSETRFEPLGSTTRAQLMTLLFRFVTWRDGVAPEATAPHTFTDVPAGAFFEDAVEWAVATGLTTGVSPTEFAPDLPTTRAELAVFIHRLTPDAIDGGAAPSAMCDHRTGSTMRWRGWQPQASPPAPPRRLRPRIDGEPRPDHHLPLALLLFSRAR